MMISSKKKNIKKERECIESEEGQYLKFERGGQEK